MRFSRSARATSHASPNSPDSRVFKGLEALYIPLYWTMLVLPLFWVHQCFACV